MQDACHHRARELIHNLHTATLTLATAESCTGGLLASCLTAVPGASHIFHAGFIAYANHAKTKLLGVKAQTIHRHGAVSPEVAKAMATGARSQAQADIGLAITGVAGPAASEHKPVGLVYIGYQGPNSPPQAWQHNFEGQRSCVRWHSVHAALTQLLELHPAEPR